MAGTPIDLIIAYECGELDEQGVLDLFQQLVNSGLAWSLQGHYGRMAVTLLDMGLITHPDLTMEREGFD